MCARMDRYIDKHTYKDEVRSFKVKAAPAAAGDVLYTLLFISKRNMRGRKRKKGDK